MSGTASAAVSVSPATEQVSVRVAVVPVTPSGDSLTPEPRRVLPPRKGASTQAVSLGMDAEEMFPEAGDEFLGFHLTEELGRGAFGRVYLAHQGDLAGRPVALKVAFDLVGESHKLAQLQHTNIVPIYSVHQSTSLQAVCMPYSGRVTLADVVRSLSGREGLPSSGRELRSTVAHCATTTASSLESSKSGSVVNVPRRGPSVPVSAPDGATQFQPLEGWARLDGLSYSGAVLWIGEQLADGLAHAHARGILHRDLKPANVLLTDDGRPMLLDFNLAEDTKTRDTADRAAVGGTLPYMSPEQLRSYRDRAGVLDGRSDIYSLGVILFELLAGRHPFPVHRGPGRLMLPGLLHDREKGAPSVREWNPTVSPAVDSIVRKCLAPNPAERYQSAEHLREDLDRQLNHRPLKYALDCSVTERARKWSRRHPRLSSMGTVVAVAASLLIALGVGAAHARERAREFDARVRLDDHDAKFRDARLFFDDRNQSRPRLGEALEQFRGILARYGVSEDGSDESWLTTGEVARLPEAERQRLRADVGEAFYLMAQVAHLRAFGSVDAEERARNLEQAKQWNRAAERYAGDRLPSALRAQRAEIAELAGRHAEAEQLRAEAARIPTDSARDMFLLGAMLTQKGRHADALPYLRRATLLAPKDFSAWFVRGTTHLALGHDDAAVACFSACLAIRDDFAPAWLNRGLAYSRLRQFDPATDDYNRALELDTKMAEAYAQRSSVRDVQDDLKGAEADLSRAIEVGGAPVRLLYIRASVRDRLNKAADAKADRDAAVRLTPTDELSWIARAENRLDDPKAALGDVEEALAINPFSVFGLQLKAHILGERLKRGDDALVVLNRAIELHPDHVPVRAGRGVELARRGKRDEALRDAKDALLRDTKAPNQYQVACIYALTSAEGKGHPEDRAEAFRLLWSSLRTGYGLDIVDTDTDLDPVRNDPEFKRLVKAARDHHAAATR